MSDKPQLVALSTTRETPLRRKVDRVWGSAFTNLREESLPDADFRSVQMFRSWLVYDSAMDAGFAPRRVNWNSVLGLTLATAISASIWVGIGLTIAHIWK